MHEQVKNLFLGLFVAAACVLVAVLILFLEPDVGDGGKTLHVRFSNVSKINVGTRVLYAGKPVGEVVAIKEIPDARNQPTDSMGRLFFYDLTLKVDSSVHVFSVDEVCVQTSGLLGEKSVAIVPRLAPHGVSVHEIIDQPVYAESVDSIEKAIGQVSTLAKEVDGWIHTWGHETGAAIASFGQASKRIDEVMHSLEAKGTFEHFASLAANITQISDKLAMGQGTIGKLLDEDGIYGQMSMLIGRFDLLASDIQRYGILFHLNKGWQREQRKRISQMQPLKDSGDCLSVAGAAISKVDTAWKSLRSGDDAEFGQRFQALLAESRALSEQLQLLQERLQVVKGDTP